MATLKAKITDREVLARVRVADLSRYLAEHGWRVGRDRSYDLFILWSFPDLDDVRRCYEVCVLRTDDLQRHATTMSENLRTLATVEGRSQLDILAEIMGVSLAELVTASAGTGALSARWFSVR